MRSGYALPVKLNIFIIQMKNVFSKLQSIFAKILGCFKLIEKKIKDLKKEINF
jgi:hypothetical protein